jgi:Leucine-rich repeat (LRR) protein
MNAKALFFGLFLFATISYGQNTPPPKTTTCEIARIVEPVNVCNLGIVGDKVIELTGASACNCVAPFALEKIQTLDFSNRQLTAIPAELFSLTKYLTGLTELNFSNNTIAQLPIGLVKQFTTLTTINMSNNRLNKLGIGSFQGMPELQVLDLSNNRFSTLPIGAFQGLNLNILNLENNQISKVDKTSFQNLSTVYLDLSGNNIAEIPNELFISLEKLVELDLSGNLISLLPQNVFNPLVSLEKLDLTNNNMTEIDAQQTGLNSKATVIGVTKL